ncbi:MAG: serine hydrolase domain-containing protein [Chlamydiales bacterium]
MSAIDSLQEELSKRVAYGYNQHLIVGEILNGDTTFTYAGDYPFKAEETLFEIGSVTKLFTAHLTFILQQEGLLSVEDHVDRYLPTSVNIKPEMRLYHLLTHTSGIQDPKSNHYINPITGNTVPAAEFTLDDLYAHLGKQVLNPGEKMIYSNLGYALLGHILENITGKDYETLLQEKILTRAKMYSTYALLPKKDENRLVKGTWMGMPAPYWHMILPAYASLKSTAKDLTLYLEALFLKLLWGKQIVHNLCKPFSPIPDYPLIIAGCGFTLDKRYGGEFYAAGGKTLGFSSFMGFDLSKQKGVVLLTDAHSLDNLGHHLLHADFPLLPLYQKSPQPFDVLQRYEGKYANEEGYFSIRAKKDHLELLEEGVRPIIFFPKGPDQFFCYDLNSAGTFIHFQDNKLFLYSEDILVDTFILSSN